MNKKGDLDFSNPKAIVSALVGLFFILLFLSLLPGIFHDSLCSNEITQLNTCNSNNAYWKGQAESLNQTIQNCTNLIQEQKNICDARVNDSIQTYKNEIKVYQEYVTSNKIFFVTYNILIIFLYVPITINLFKIVFKLEFGEEWKRLREWYKKAFLVFKILLWIVLTLLFIAYILLIAFGHPI